MPRAPERFARAATCAAVFGALLGASADLALAQDAALREPKLTSLVVLFDSTARHDSVNARVRRVLERDGLISMDLPALWWDYAHAPVVYSAIVASAGPRGIALVLSVQLVAADTVKGDLVSRLLTSHDRAEWERLERLAAAIKGAALRCDTIAARNALQCR